MSIPEAMQIMPARMNSNMMRPEFKPKLLKNSPSNLKNFGSKPVKNISSKARMTMENCCQSFDVPYRRHKSLLVICFHVMVGRVNIR